MPLALVRVRSTDVLIPPESATRSRLALALVFLQVFVSEVPRGIVLPDMEPHLAELTSDSRQYNAYSVSMFSLGRFCASIPYGYLIDRTGSSRTAFLIAGVITIVGQCVYMIPNAVAVLLSRFIIGVGTGTLPVTRAYMVRASAPAQRTQFLSVNTMVQYIGLNVSPLLATLLPVGAYGPSAVVIGANVVMMAVLVQLMAPTDGGREECGGVAESVPMGGDGRVLLRSDLTFALFLFLNLGVRGVMSMAEVVAAPQYQALYEFADSDQAVIASARFLFILGLIGVVVFLSIKTLIRVMSPMDLLQWGMGVILIGSAMILASNHDQVRYAIGMGLIWSVGGPITLVLTISACSHLFEYGQQGVIMGWLTVAGAAGRILLPVMATGDAQLAYVVMIGTMALSMMVVALFPTFITNKSDTPI